jgi:hypothetical protein
VSLTLGDRLVFNAPGNDEKLAFIKFDDPVTKMNRQVAVENQEELVLRY